MTRNIHISKICDEFGLSYCGNDLIINGLGLCNRLCQFDRVLSYVTNSYYSNSILNNEAICALILSKNDFSTYNRLERNLTFIFSESPEETFYRIHFYLIEKSDFYSKEIETPKIGSNCKIHKSVIIGSNVNIGNNVVIGANTVIGSGTIIGDNVYIGCNSSIGSDGFQIIHISGKNVRIPHVGGVCIKNDASVGDNVTINKSLFDGFTMIGENSMIDSQTYIAHNVEIGDNSCVCAQNAFCGSSKIENNSFVGVNCSIRNRIIIGEGSIIGMGSVVTKNVKKNVTVYGEAAKERSLIMTASNDFEFNRNPE